MGVVSCSRGHVVAEIPPETCWVSWRGAELPPRHRCAHDGDQSVEEGRTPRPSPSRLRLTFCQDVAASQPTIISLPIAALPHIATPSLAMSLLSDLLPRLSHSHAAIRKKTVVTLYRLALVYPEALRAAWPKIKERLMDGDEDSSVTAAIVNIVCELGWRRPHDFLPLAPRLFELLVDGGNNWMAIKLIKLVRRPALSLHRVTLTVL